MAESSQFSCDLVLESQKHFGFLRKMHASGVSLQPVTSKMLERYRLLWLPLLADYCKERVTNHLMIPPSDVAWLWHCHRLAPSHYENYTERTFGLVLEPTPAFVFVLHEQDGDCHMDDIVRTRQLWEKKYPEEPFFLQEQAVLAKPVAMENGSSLLFEDFDLVASCKCQANFLWQVSGSRYHDADFLMQAKENYYKFLSLVDSQVKLPLVPTYQIDLMWHTHILVNCKQYKVDCQAIRGKPFHHDDSLNDRTTGGKLDQAFRATAKAWEQKYGESYVAEGGMYRGEPPLVYYDTSDLWVTATMACKDLFGGSSSSGRDMTNTNTQSTAPWENIGSPRAFIPADAKSTIRNINNNPQKDGFIFGRGTMNDGYYSLRTKEAWILLHSRLKTHLLAAKVELKKFDRYHLLLIRPFLFSFEKRKRSALEEKIQTLRTLMAFAHIMKKASGPDHQPTASEMRQVLGYDIPLVCHADCITAAGCGGEKGTKKGGACGGGAACGTAACGSTTDRPAGQKSYVFGGGRAGGCGGGGCGGGGCGG